ncbi:1-phosphatidylinositol-3-phosphate 5-kinase [Operophtera brumata]|uniref:1-phosphatidylinositol-3-phosphate 5-kinase n=1 Tax=Operophtera brumata TaxID=104452 RepID=A0A0L7LGN6_OPEBR|nr:1-phosphatidylinositol-3-phosphate 5-kinase [Operophtera brumata]
MEKYDTSQLTEFPRFEAESTQSGVSTFFTKLWKLPLFTPTEGGEIAQIKSSADETQDGPSTADQSKKENEVLTSEVPTYAHELEVRSLPNVVRRIASLIASGSGVKFPDNKEQTSKSENFVFARDQEERSEVRSSSKETLQDVFQQLSYTLPTQQHRVQATMICQNLLSSGYMECVTELPHFADYALYRPITATARDDEDDDDESEERSRLVESVSSYCLDLNLGESSARLIKTPKTGPTESKPECKAISTWGEEHLRLLMRQWVARAGLPPAWLDALYPLCAQAADIIVPDGTKTLMVLEGCPESQLACCILLRGGSVHELIRVKKIVKFMLLACYNWKLEKAFLADIEAVLPEPGMTFEDETIDSEINKTEAKDTEVNDEKDLENDLKDDEIPEKGDFIDDPLQRPKSYPRKTENLSCGVPIKDFSDPLRSTLSVDDDVWCADDVVLSMSPSVLIPAPYLETEAGRRCPLRGNFHAPLLRTPAAAIVTMEMYGRHDISLGAFLEKYCFNADYKCNPATCHVPMNQHVRRSVIPYFTFIHIM